MTSVSESNAGGSTPPAFSLTPPPTPPANLYGILGHPLGHTLSPPLHTWSFHVLGVPAAYMRWDVPPESLGTFMDAVRVLPVAGASVTIPHKEAVIPHLDGLSAMAGRIGAVNTLYWKDGDLLGENTDVIGFLAPLAGAGFDSAMVLGAGGAARAVLAGLKDKGLGRIFLTNRSLARAQGLAREFDVQAVPWEERTQERCDLLVNTTPLGMFGDMVGETPWPAEDFSPGQTVYDLVYNPQQTRFLREASEAGCETVDGLSMFLGQARAQCQLWTGRKFPLQDGRQLLVSLLTKK